MADEQTKEVMYHGRNWYVRGPAGDFCYAGFATLECPECESDSTKFCGAVEEKEETHCRMKCECCGCEFTLEKGK